MSNQERPDRVHAAVRQVVGDQVGAAPPPKPWAEVVSAACGVDAKRSGAAGFRRPRVVAVAAAACLVALVAGLVVVSRDGSTDRSAAPDDALPVTQVPLSQVDSLGPGDWVVPSAAPDEVDFLWATVRANSNVVAMGDDPNRPSYVFEVTFPISRSTGPTVPIVSETEWVMTALEIGWRTRRGVGPALVAVNGPGGFDDAAEALLDGLVVVSAEGLPQPPVDPDGPMTEVASFDIDGVVYTYSVVGTPAYACVRVDEAGLGASGYCGPFTAEGDVFASFTGGGGYTYTEDSDVIRATADGAVRSDVARVEVEFIDGTTVSVEPMNTSDVFPELRFWVVVADVNVPDLRSFENLTPVAEQRAFDADDTLLNRARPADEFG